MSPRERLAAVLAPELLAALEELAQEQVDERLRVLSAKRLNGRQRSEFLTVDQAPTCAVQTGSASTTCAPPAG